MREAFEGQLSLLHKELTEMGSQCEQIISLASQALTHWDQEIGKQVSQVGGAIDEKERTIEAICMKLLLRQQPVAGDLRNISAALRMIADMERIGDQTADIADITKNLTDFQLASLVLIFAFVKTDRKSVV